jgi:hypothetical protein
MKQHKSTSKDNQLLSEMYGRIGGMTIQTTGNAEEAAEQLAQDDGFDSAEEAAEDHSTIKPGNIYRGQSYDEIVVKIEGDEVFTRELAEGGNRYDINQMLNELELIDKIEDEEHGEGHDEPSEDEAYM